MTQLDGFKKLALQFSGGKDSLACLYLLQDRLHEITVYWLNTGDGCPETVDLVQHVRTMVPNFVEITTDVKAWRAKHGMPSDIVPANSHYIGSYYGLSGPRLTNRFDCCAENLMRPLHERMIADGVDCVIRGTKKCDTGTVPAEGDTGPYHVVLPIKDWSHQDVFDYLASVDAPYNPLYDFYKGISAPECFGCTAWWEDGKSAYFKALHPERLGEYRANLEEIKAALHTHLADLDFELRS